MSNPSKVNIIGPFPPPYGGISVHIKRVYQHLENENIHFFNTADNDVTMDKVSSLSKMRLFSFFFRPNELFHYHSTSINIRLVLCVLSLINPFVYLHIHGASLTDQLKSDSLKGKLLKKLLPTVNIICSNSEIFRFIDENYSIKNLYSFDAFIPPTYNELEFSQIQNSIKQPDSKYLISMTGWFSCYKEQDLYGFDIMLQALRQLRSSGIDVSVIASVNGINDQKIYNSFLADRDKYNLKEHFVLIMEDLKELYPIIKISDLFIRPTNTDGNAVSIKEALWFDIPVIASDIVPRPKEVILFKNRDVDDLAKKIEHTLFSSQKKEDAKQVFNRQFEHPMIKEIYGFK